MEYCFESEVQLTAMLIAVDIPWGNGTKNQLLMRSVKKARKNKNGGRGKGFRKQQTNGASNS